MDFKEAVRFLGAPVELTPDDIKNRWTTETLTIYIAEAKQREASLILDKPNQRQTATVTRMRWLRR